jgi:hypothetical protein
MTWNLKYWDILDQLYWSPKYIGLRSIQKNNRTSLPSDWKTALSNLSGFGDESSLR